MYDKHIHSHFNMIEFVYWAGRQFYLFYYLYKSYFSHLFKKKNQETYITKGMFTKTKDNLCKYNYTSRDDLI